MTRNDAEADETSLATRNAVKLGSSLLFTWGIAIAMRFLLPRYLGPDRFGTLSFADAFTTTFFVVLGLGVNVYVRKNVSVETSHASDFIGGAFVLRVVLSLFVFAALAIFMNVTGQAPAVRHLVYLFALAQFFVQTNATLSALLHARGTVGGMSVLAVVTKVVWAVGVLAAIVLGSGLWGFALAYLASEGIESFVLMGLASRHMGLVLRVDFAATKAMIVFSMPFYLNDIATIAYGKLDVALLAAVASSREIGWYAAASAIAGLTLLATPLIGWVLMPTFARAAARSHDELFARIRRSTDLILTVAIPASLLICLGADIGVKAIFGAAFAPAALALRILSATFVVTYVAIVFAITLLMLDRAWTLTAISMAGLAVNVGLNLVLVRPSIAHFGDGGGGAGCALAMLGTELFVTTAMISTVGRRTFDRRMLSMIGKSIAACGLAVIVDRVSRSLGPVRLVLDGAVYGSVVVATGAVNTREIVTILRAALRSKVTLDATIKDAAPGTG